MYLGQIENLNIVDSVVQTRISNAKHVTLTLVFCKLPDGGGSSDTSSSVTLSVMVRRNQGNLP